MKLKIRRFRNQEITIFCILNLLFYFFVKLGFTDEKFMFGQQNLNLTIHKLYDRFL